jgi:hypothetical protein
MPAFGLEAPGFSRGESSQDGKRKTFYGKTRQEAAKLLKEALRDLEQGLPAEVKARR